ncbi:MAG: Mov34/MPN/PAD-1 family protein, partial [Candidatus Heimdallarchaeota archaeon]|nr:Mov34/MPN/PAD-1 family protein [Candidatus Heimdallarchaeota archaeon]
MSENRMISIFVQFNQSVHDIIVKEASSWPDLETGGMLFGKITESENSLSVTIDKTYIPPDSSCIRKSSYFEIDPDQAKEILESESALYLGNWHKHLGYGGPSSGDHRQIEDFFLNNPHLN